MMGMYDMFKDAVSMAQKADNIDLVKTILELQQKMLELQEENINLNEEKRKLESIISEIKTIEFKDDCYYFDGDGPYCSRCYDAEKKKIRMLKFDTQLGSIYNRCPNCKNEVLKETYHANIMNL
ncbi:hypothetical protein [Frisingicoccus sp.]|uniref:hypothetical protein n=1 Tax=Frisingicoccus sp. TaxID=1918627 RepID=UPI003AB64071